MIQKILNLLLISIFSLPLASPVWGEERTVLERIKQTGILKVAIREDAAPFGYRDNNNNLSGLCLDLIAQIRDKVQTELGMQAISIYLFKSTLANRFELVEKQIVDLECGPNTINKDHADIQFSDPFFITGTKFIIPASENQEINLDGTLAGVTIGVLRNTTNQVFIQQKYPNAILKEFQGTTGRRRGVQALQEGKIDAFASDGILLIGEAVLQGLALGTDYLLIPSTPLDCSAFGLILPKNDTQWQTLVNSVMDDTNSLQLFEKWFGGVLPIIKVGIDYCLPRLKNELANY